MIMTGSLRNTFADPLHGAPSTLSNADRVLSDKDAADITDVKITELLRAGFISSRAEGTPLSAMSKHHPFLLSSALRLTRFSAPYRKVLYLL
ncbi:hypothetical protein M8J76_009317 [Diaphorina citri]|nr:hypothetical protein M8J76_009317 [Diaphorina citri]